MKVTWLGQAGLLFEWEDCTLLVDPYLSDSVEKIQPNHYRRVPVDTRLWELRPDVLICTHNHLDHTDPETLAHYLQREEPVTVLAPRSSWNEVRKFGGVHNYVQFNRHTQWTQQRQRGELRFEAVRAEHSDPDAIGVVVYDGAHRYYITGDTLYNREIFDDLPAPIDLLFLPINGVGNNMNLQDAQRFALMAGAREVIPIHFGMFDQLDPRGQVPDNWVVPEIYREIPLE